MGADEYRRVHELKPTFGLHFSELTAHRSAIQKELFRDPAVRAAFRPRSSVPDLMARASAARREAIATRAGSRAARAETVRRAVEVRRQQSDARFDERARALGHRDLFEMLEESAERTNSALARLLGVDHKSVMYLRRRHGYPWPTGSAASRADPR